MIDHNIIDVTGEDICIDIQIDDLDNVHLNKHMSSSISEIGIPAMGRLPSFSVMKLNSDGNLLWIRQFWVNLMQWPSILLSKMKALDYYPNSLFEDNEATHTIDLIDTVLEEDGEAITFNESLLEVVGMTLIKDQLFIYGSSGTL